MHQLMKVAVSLAVLAMPAFAQGTPQRRASQPSTDQARKDQALTANGNRESRDRQARPRENDRPTIGPQTTQGLAQDAITRSDSR